MEYINEFLGKDFTKTKNAIISCTNVDQLRTAWNMIEIYRIKNPDLKREYELLLAYYEAKKDQFIPVKTSPEIQSI